MLCSTGTSIMMATSPNRVSISTSTTVEPVVRTNAVAKFVAMVVLPMPPLAPKIVTVIPRADASVIWPERRMRLRSSCSRTPCMERMSSSGLTGLIR